jgi:hypothetical protein
VAYPSLSNYIKTILSFSKKYCLAAGNVGYVQKQLHESSPVMIGLGRKPKRTLVPEILTRLGFLTISIWTASN